MSAGLSQARLETMHRVLAGHVQRGSVPGAVALVERRGEVRVETVGTLAIGDSAPVQRDSIFRIASITKPITAVAALMLVEECRLRLDEPVDRLLPELAGRRVLRRIDAPLHETLPAWRPITLRDLLTFTAGYGLVFAAPGQVPVADALNTLLAQGPPSPAAFVAPDEWIRRLGTLPLLHQPGEQWRYNTASDILGVLIARASGHAFDVFLRERIFEPLGMKDTGFSVPAADLGRLATAFATSPATGEVEVYDPADGGQWSQPPAFPSGAGGLVSTVDDLAAFGRMLLGGGRLGSKRLLSRPTVAAMVADQLSAAQKAATEWMPGYFEGHGWGFGLAVATSRRDPSEPPGSFGWDGGLGTSWRCDPGEDMITILLTQQAWTSPVPPEVCVDFRTAAYAAIDD